MTDVFIREATLRTPRIELNPDTQTLLIEGESYPEEIYRFYDPVFESFDHYFSQPGCRLRCTINLSYFNSSSARQLLEMLNRLEAQANKGHEIHVDWFCISDDDIMQEFAEDIAEEVNRLQFHIRINERDDA